MTTTTTTTTTTPISRLQALRERWDLVRSKIDAVWSHAKAIFKHPVIFSLMATLVVGSVLIGIAVFGIRHSSGDRKEPTTTATTTSPDLAALERRISALEVQLALSPWPSPAVAPAPAAASSRRAPARTAPAAAAAHAAPFTGPAYPQADATPAPSAWGTTDLDRAIQQFTPPPATPPAAQ